MVTIKSPALQSELCCLFTRAEQPAKPAAGGIAKAIADILYGSKKIRLGRTANDSFGGVTPIQVIEVGEIDRLWQMVDQMSTDSIS
jgi:hypothetical protein